MSKDSPDLIERMILPAKGHSPLVLRSNHLLRRAITSKLSKDIAIFEKGKIGITYSSISGRSDIVGRRDNYKLYRKIYEQVGVVANAIKNTSDFAIQAGYEIECSDKAKKVVMDFIRKFNFDLFLVNIMTQMQIYGNAYLELTWDGTIEKMKFLPVESIFITRNDEGDITGYVQISPTTKKEINFKLDEIAHFPWNVVGTSYYGISDIKPNLGTIRRLLNWHEDLGEILHNYAAPILHHKVGTNELPADQSTLDDYKGELEQREVGEDIITTSAFEIVPISSQQKMMQPDGMVKNLENQLIAGLRVPEIFVRGGETSNKATADIEMQAFERKVKALQEAVSRIVEDKILNPLSGEEVKLTWNSINVEGELNRTQRLNTLVMTGIPISVALRMVGWGSWVNDIKTEVSNEPAQQDKDKQDKDNTESKIRTLIAGGIDRKTAEERVNKGLDQYKDEYLSRKLLK